MVRMGPRMGPRVGPRLGPNPSFSSAPTIYDQVAAGTVNTYLQGLLSSASDFAPLSLWNFDTVGNDQFAADLGSYGYDLDGLGGTGLVASPHGTSAPQTAASGYWAGGADPAYEVATSAFAFAGRVKFTAKPAGIAGWMARGSAASAHYRATIDASGFPAMAAKQSGGETVASVSVDVTDGVWRWLLCGRTVTSELLWIHLDDGNATAAFANTKDLTNGVAAFGLWDGNTAGGVTCQVDHLLAWVGAAAENVYTNRVALLAALDGME